ncbi:Protein fuzzy -like protein [Halotydeus destructor]|nr:Protein fuzzy -like protein [Halotydeus destructor]
MSAHLVGVTALGGVPLFSRQAGQQESEQSVPFATLAALNGVNLFSRLNDADLKSTTTKNSRIHWKVFEGNIVLILLTKTNMTNLETISSTCVENMLHLVFDALIFCCGSEEISGQNVERLKRSLRLAYPLVDYLLEQLLVREKHFNIITKTLSYIHIDGQVKEFMDSLIDWFKDLAQTDFSFILVNGKILTASEGWWSRISQSKDAVLVLAMVHCVLESIETESDNVKEIPVFLPDNCPTAITRLIIAKIYQDVHLVALCGENPPLESLVSEGLNIIRESDNHQEHLRKLHMLRYGSTLPVDDRILSIILIKHDHRIMLRYGHADDMKLKDMLTMVEMSSTRNISLEKPKELYVKFRSFQGFKLSHDQNELYTLFPLIMSLSEMRLISLKMLQLFKDKRLWPRT